MDRKLTRRFCVAVGIALAASGLAGVAAVGAARADSAGPSQPLPVHGVLHGVAATSASNAWAVGETSTSSGFSTLILRWNGTAWNRVPVPGPPGNLLSVAATSARNAWAVGYPYTGVDALILHWNGTA